MPFRVMIFGNSNLVIRLPMPDAALCRRISAITPRITHVALARSTRFFERSPPMREIGSPDTPSARVSPSHSCITAPRPQPLLSSPGSVSWAPLRVNSAPTSHDTQPFSIAGPSCRGSPASSPRSASSSRSVAWAFIPSSPGRRRSPSPWAVVPACGQATIPCPISGMVAIRLSSSRCSRCQSCSLSCSGGADIWACVPI